MTEPQYNLEQLNVVVVDDNKYMIELIESILFALGVKHIHSFADGLQAYRALQHFPADLIITDWHMEPIDGLELVRMIRTAQDSPNPYLPIVMLTGHSELKRVIDARDAGINEFLAKPIAAKSLYLRIVSIIENPRPSSAPRAISARAGDARTRGRLAECANGGATSWKRSSRARGSRLKSSKSSCGRDRSIGKQGQACRDE